MGMRVGSDYQANIPEFEPGEFFLDSAGVTDGGSLGTDCNGSQRQPVTAV